VQAALQRAGVADHTYLVFSSDNGFHLGQHGLLPGKRTAFDTDVRVPLIVTGPEVPAGERVDALASNVDLAPTFLDIGRVPVPRRVEGRSLLGWWHGKPAALWRNAVLVDYLAAALHPSDPDRQAPGAGRPTRYQALRRADGLFVAYDDGERELYDLRRDPLQQNNVAAGAAPAVRAAWEAQLAALGRCFDGPTCHAADRPPVSGPTAGSPTTWLR
jgi:N-acetylglucosamine-6-sulfatase